MTLELALNRALLLPRFIRTGQNKPSKIHWVGNREPIQQNQSQDGGKKNESRKRDVRGYRDLDSITIGDVNDAFERFSRQLLPSPYESWIAKNYFCMIELIKKRGRPPAMFGRMKICYPSDGYIQNIQEMEIHFPRKDGAPDVILLHADDIPSRQQNSVRSYCMRLKFLASQEDIADFNGCETLFWERGFVPEFETGFLDLLDSNEQNHDVLPWLYVISSRWLASIPSSVQTEVKEKLTKMIHWNKTIFNYHPEELPSDIKTLNRELGFKVGFTDHFLIEPETPQQTAQIVAATFDAMFMQSPPRR
jgi:hypothetical protein